MSEKKKANIIEVDDLKSFFRIFFKNWYIIFAFILVSGVSSYFYTYKMPDVFAAKTQILLKNDETYDYQAQLYKGLGYYNAYEDNVNQIRVLTSNNIIEKALSKLKLNSSYFIVGRLKTTEVYQSMPFEFDVKQLNIGLYEQPIKFKILNEHKFEITYLKNGLDVVKSFAFNKKIIDADFVLTVKKNANINDQTIISLKDIDYVVKIHNIENLVASFKNALSIENLESTTVLELTLEDQIPSRAVTFLDTLSSVYIDYTAQAQFVINENTLVNIDKQLAGVVEVLKSIEDDLEGFKSNKEILDLPKQEEQYFKELIEYDAKKRTLELWVQSLASLEKYILTIGDSKEDKLLPPSFYIGEGDDYLRTAINELYTLQMSRNSRLFSSTEDNRNISELDQTTDLLKKNILTYIGNSQKGLAQRIQDINKQIGDFTTIIKGIPKTQRDLLSIQRKVDVNEKMYVYLLERRANTIIARAGILPQTSVIETAHSVGVVKPNKRKISYSFLFVGLVLSLLVVFIRMVVFATIESMDELKRLTHLPVLGEIILSKEATDDYLIVDKDVKAPITESFRAIRTNLEYFANEVNSKAVLVTSYNPGEGKTFCSVNLAAIIAKAGKRVLLIELDLHKPKIQQALKMSSDVGVSTILIGKSSIQSTVMDTQIENLSVILSGPTPPNASELILSKHLKELLDYGRAHFDYVVVDTAPIGLITDALVIMKNVDVSLFVLNTKFAKKQILDVVHDISKANKVSNIGLILNGVKRNRSKYYYNYGYGYGYGYGGYGKGGKK